MTEVTQAVKDHLQSNDLTVVLLQHLKKNYFKYIIIILTTKVVE